MLPKRRTARAIAALFGVLAPLIVVSTLLPTALDRALGWLALPLLAEIVFISTDPRRSRFVRLAVAGLLVAAAADVVRLLMASGALALELGLYLAGLIAWCVALWPLRADSVLMRRRSWLLLYGTIAAIAMFGAVSGSSGALLVLALGYLGAAAALAVLSTSLGLAGGAGGACLLLAHVLTALVAFVPAWDLPAMPAWIAAFYLGGTALLTAGFLRHSGLLGQRAFSETRQ